MFIEPGSFADPKNSLWGAMKVIFVVAVAAIACGHARAAEKAMPINFIGEWCLTSKVDTMAFYALPSWTANRGCTKILSIEKNGFFGEGRHCNPMTMRLKTYISSFGIGYIATVTARCQSDDPVTAGTLQTFEFNRYKGNLTVTTK
jgi:hypothetical protein